MVRKGICTPMDSKVSKASIAIQHTNHKNSSREHPFDDDGGPLSRVLSRRSALWLFGGGGLLSMAALTGCGGGSSVTGTTTTTGTTGTGSSTSTGTTGSTGSTSTGTGTSTSGCVLIPSETQGPYPLLSVLSNSGIVRKDITDGKTGIPLTVVLNLQNVGNSCGPISNAAVYIWHCDKDGGYSGYSSGQNGNYSGQTFLRGVQMSDSNGQVTFTTIYPGWYAGRITHIHFQVYLNGTSNLVTATSQIALPLDINQTVYASSLYVSHGQNTSVTSFAQDNIFSDGTTYQLATVTGSLTAGYTATLNVGVAAG
jgi:protocatechuate 3,4-dioxygenase beta subunit